MIKHIYSFTQAVGWAALYKRGEESLAQPLVGWAHGTWTEIVECRPVEHEGVFGLVVGDGGEIVPAPALEGFVTYEYDLDGASIDYLSLNNGN
jgi:hypothetical protein